MVELVKHFLDAAPSLSVAVDALEALAVSLQMVVDALEALAVLQQPLEAPPLPLQMAFSKVHHGEGGSHQHPP